MRLPIPGGLRTPPPYCPACLDRWYTREALWPVAQLGMHERCRAVLTEIRDR